MRLLALDIGGANLKAASAVLDDEGRLRDLSATAVPFALWLAPDALSERLRAVVASTHEPDVILATMTGELCDCFEDRRQGVAFIVSQLQRSFAGQPVHVWSVDDGFMPLQDAAVRWLSVASSNWHILATHLAQQAGKGVSLMIDIGSTTTDIVLLRDGEVVAQGRTDEARLKTGEMIYTGVRRTPVMALTGAVMGECDLPPMMAERFATMADVHVLLGDIPEDQSDTDTADGRPLTKRCAANRLLRMIGSDLAIGLLDAAHDLAKRLAARQTSMIVQGITRIAGCHGQRSEALRAESSVTAARESRRDADDCARRLAALSVAPCPGHHVPCAGMVTAHDLPQRIYISGSGVFLAKRAAVLALPGVEVVDWAGGMSPHAAEAACAVALLHQWAAHRHADVWHETPDCKAEYPCPHHSI